MTWMGGIHVLLLWTHDQDLFWIFWTCAKSVLRKKWQQPSKSKAICPPPQHQENEEYGSAVTQYEEDRHYFNSKKAGGLWRALWLKICSLTILAYISRYNKVVQFSLPVWQNEHLGLPLLLVTFVKNLFFVTPTGVGTRDDMDERECFLRRLWLWAYSWPIKSPPDIEALADPGGGPWGLLLTIVISSPPQAHSSARRALVFQEKPEVSSPSGNFSISPMPTTTATIQFPTSDE